MAIKIHTTSDIAAEGANIVLYGESGVGKTTLISHLNNPLILSADKGLLSLKRFDIPYVEIHNMSDVDDAYNLVIKSDYENIVFDSLTEMAEEVLFELKVGKKDKRQAYGELADAFGVMIRKFRDIKGKNIIFISKNDHKTDEEGSVIGYEPMLPGRVLPHGLPYLTDEVFAYRMDRNGKRYLQTSAERKWPAKDRSGNLEQKEYEPNLQEIIDRILSKEK